MSAPFTPSDVPNPYTVLSSEQPAADNVGGSGGGRSGDVGEVVTGDVAAAVGSGGGSRVQAGSADEGARGDRSREQMSAEADSATTKVAANDSPLPATVVAGSGAEAEAAARAAAGAKSSSASPDSPQLQSEGGISGGGGNIGGRREGTGGGGSGDFKETSGGVAWEVGSGAPLVAPGGSEDRIGGGGGGGGGNSLMSSLAGGGGGGGGVKGDGEGRSGAGGASGGGGLLGAVTQGIAKLAATASSITGSSHDKGRSDEGK